MKDDNLDLFAPDHQELGELLDRLDNIPPAETGKYWGQMLAGLIDLFCCELKRQGEQEDKALSQAGKLVATLAHYYGGRSCYLPVGDRLKTAIRDNMLYHDYTRGNGDISALADRYKLTDSRVYQIVKDQMVLHRNRHQLTLFGKES
ncbi:Mor transcription activator family protein [Limnobaculum xujianqingii]|uniref:Mor transcription activator family protein n=1 Tax=Limnobaculum xujianqingii TaxID=2738837 RepID=UPI001129C4B3|nr:Mor transcription activator family protein [Limnobaculum xujianqingii]